MPDFLIAPVCIGSIVAIGIAYLFLMRRFPILKKIGLGLAVVCVVAVCFGIFGSFYAKDIERQKVMKYRNEFDEAIGFSTCPFCKEQTKPLATKCPHCLSVIER